MAQRRQLGEEANQLDRGWKGLVQRFYKHFCVAEKMHRIGFSPQQELLGFLIRSRLGPR